MLLHVLQCCGSVCPATACSLMRDTAVVNYSYVVDLYNSATGTWSTAQLSVGRFWFAAASVGNVALFAGGATGRALLCRDRDLECLWLRACWMFCACCSVAVLFALRPLALSCAPLVHCRCYVYDFPCV